MMRHDSTHSTHWFAEQLRSARLMSGLTIAQLARDTGVSRAAIYEYETARRQPSIDRARYLLEACGLQLMLVNKEEYDVHPKQTIVIEPEWAECPHAPATEAYRRPV